MNAHRAVLAAALAALAAAGCDAVPDNPTWAADVAPILRANCIRCHTAPPTGAAPGGFRLDVLGLSQTDEGRYLVGARAMRRFMAERVDHLSMPPRFPLTKRQIEILQRWADNPDTTANPDNRRPVMSLRVGALEGGFQTLAFDLDDADDELVVGRLEARGAAGDPIPLTRELRSGRGAVRWDVAATPPGDYQLVAVVDDGNGEVTLELASYRVQHPDGPAPAIALSLPTSPEDSSHLPLLTDADAPYAVGLTVTDGEAVTVELVRYLNAPDEEGIVVEDAAGEPGLQWDVAAIDPATGQPRYPAGDGWRLRVTASRGPFTRVALSRPFSIGHGTTTLGYADVEGILADSCGPCHNAGDTEAQAGLRFDFLSYGGSGGVHASRGRIYERAIVQRNMPPVSARLFKFIPEDGMSEADRQTLRTWLLGGAPQ
jgi:hypothetical protein